jgi:hypothetical protein
MEYKALYIKQEEWEKYKLKSFDEAVRIFENKDEGGMQNV